VPPAAAADVQAEVVGDVVQADLQRVHHARGDPRGVPVHAHHGAERLEPERVRQPREPCVAPVVQHDGLGDHATQHGHPLRQPRRDRAPVQRKIRGSRSCTHTPVQYHRVRNPARPNRAAQTVHDALQPSEPTSPRQAAGTALRAMRSFSMNTFSRRPRAGAVAPGHTALGACRT
jgi:hypothetical protein